MPDEREPHPPEPAPFPETYYRARRAYLLAGVVLLGWEFIGFELPSELDVLGVKTKLQQPQLAPTLLALLLLYLGVRYCIEWAQSSHSRRVLRASRFDFLLAHGIGFVALAPYALRRAAGFEDLRARQLVGLGFLLGFAFGVLLTWRRERPLPPLEGRRARYSYLLFKGLSIATVALWLLVLLSPHYRQLLRGEVLFLTILSEGLGFVGAWGFGNIPGVGNALLKWWRS